MTSRPRPLVAFSELALVEGGLRLTWEVSSGDRVAVMGASGSGKSLLLDLIVNHESPAAGSVVLSGKVIAGGFGGYSRRHTPMLVARAASEDDDAVVEVLSALSLWDDRDRPVLNLPPGMLAAADLLEPLLSSEDVVLLDGHLDSLDPWTLRSVFDVIDRQSAEGRAFVVSTNSPGIAERLGAIIVLRDSSVRFAGTVTELIQHARPAELLVETDDESLVAEICRPFSISIRRARQGMLIKSERGQQAAAELLLKGYGRVKSVLVREPSFEEALLELF